MPDARDVILKHIAAVNDRDSAADPWAADAELVAPGGGASGRDEVIGFLGVFQEAFPDLRLEVRQLLSDGPAAALKGQSWAPTTACSVPRTVTLRRQGEPLSSGGRRSTPPTGTR